MTAGSSRNSGLAAVIVGAGLGLALGLGLAPGFGNALAEGSIGPAMRINDQVVTSYELDQRIKLMTALNQKGDVTKAARDSLIDDRLRHAAAIGQGVSVANAEIQQGMTEYAARGKLTIDQLLDYLGQRGVDAEALRDFIRSGVEWRAAVRSKFLGHVTVTEPEIDRAIAAGVAAGGELEVQLSEVFLPNATTPDQTDPALLAQRLIEGSHSNNSFQVFAQMYSKGPTAANGGRLDWQPISALPPAVKAAVSGLKPGEVSAAIPVEGGIAIYLLRDVNQSAGPATPSYDVDFAVMRFAAGQSAEAADVASRTTTCDALYPVGRNLPEEALLRQTTAQRSLPGPYGSLIAGMDPGEIRLSPRADGGTDLVMLCAMIPQTQVPASRDAVKQQILNRKIGLLAEGWLNQLHSNAMIVAY